MKLNLKTNDCITVYDKLEYVVYDNKEKFIISGKALEIDTDDNKTFDFASILLNLLNLSETEFQNLENHIGLLNSVITIKPYNIEKAILQKCKIYLDDINTKNLIDKYEIFKISCEMGYFKKVESYERYNLKNITNKNNNIKKYSSENLNYIYKCYKENKIKSLTAYNIEDFEDFVVAVLSEILKRGKTIKKCVHCHRYFMPKNRNDTIYCDNPSPEDKTKSCQEYGPQNKLEQDDVYNTYRKISKSLNNRMHYYSKDEVLCKEHENKFETFKDEGKEKWSQFKNGDITKEDYTKWLEEQAKKYNIDLKE